MAQRNMNGALKAPAQWGGAGDSLASLADRSGTQELTGGMSAMLLSSDESMSQNITYHSQADAIKESNMVPGTSHMTDTEEQQVLNNAARSASALGLDFSQQILTFAPAAPGSSQDGQANAAAAAALRARRAAALNNAGNASLAGRRKISNKPDKVLDAADICDDFYYNLIDWSVKNQVAIALRRSAYIWDCEEAVVFELLDLAEEPERLGGGEAALITSIKWHPDGELLIVGTEGGYAQVWDTTQKRRIRTFKPSAEGGATASMICALDWADPSTVTLGYGSGLVADHDIRQAESVVRSFNAHSGSACGIIWRDDGGLLATGGNDNMVKVYNRHSETPIMSRAEHKAAIKAMSWCPFNANLLATGGGSACRSVNIWNCDTNARLMSWQTEAQISSLHWSWYHRELLTTHGSADGSPSGSINLWSYPSGKNVHRIDHAHEGRILGSVLSPDGQKLASVDTGANELRFWTVFEASEEQKKRHRQTKGAELYNPLEQDQGQARSHSLIR